MKTYLLPLLAAALCTQSFADIVETKIAYTDGDTKFEGVLIYDEAIQTPVPAVLMVPNWMGVTDAAVKKAKQLAGKNHVYFVADMYGIDVRPKDAAEAGAAAGFVRSDRPLMRKRAQLALDTFLKQKSPADPQRTAAIGFCFGGGTVLELGRTGADLDAIVSFHGDLVSPTLEEDAAKTEAQVLVLHGAADPFVSQDDVNSFEAAMLKTNVDWQLIQFSKTVHAFTDPDAKMTGKAEYNEQSAKRAFEYMNQLFAELF
jgi:dienelactone hydrolase